MPSLKDIRKRIVSVKNTQKITRAMKLVAAAKLRRAQGAMDEFRPYASKYREMLGSLVSVAGGDSGQAPHELLQHHESQDALAVLLITSDRGMCGGFNGNLLKMVQAGIERRVESGQKVYVYPVGRRAIKFAERGGYNVPTTFGESISAADPERVREITEALTAGFLSGEFDEVLVAVNRFGSVINQMPTADTLLPVEAAESEGEGDGVGADMLYEPDEETLLGHVAPRYVEVLVREAILESIAGEHAARMNAMNSATDNATEMISSLTLQMNRARQAAITTELMEIIGGSEALK
jgi:F-type H+-transporting ATPase subunit gamma